MTQTAEASSDSRPLAGSARAFRRRPRALARGRRDRARGDGVPAAPADGLGAARGRDARALRRTRQPGGRRRARDPRARRRAAPLPLRVRRRASRPRPRQPAARLGGVRGRRACRWWRCSAGASPTARRRSIATALVAGSWVFLFHGVYARMYSLFLFLSLLSFVLLLRALDRGSVAAVGALGQSRSCSRSPPTRTARSCSRRRRSSCSPPAASGCGRRRRVRRRGRRRNPVLAHRSRPRRSLRRRRRRRRREARRAVGDRHLPVADGGGLQHRALARPRRRARCSRSSGSSPSGAETRALDALCVIGVPVAAFLAARLGGSTSPESRHLIFVPPVLRDPRRRGNPPQHASLPGGSGRAHRRARRPRGRLGLAPHAAALRMGAEQAPGDARPGRALPRHDEPSGRHPLRLRAALPRRVGAQPVLPEHRPPACRRGARAPHARATQPKPLGRGVWILDASERNNLRPRLEIENRDPGPPGLFETRVFGPFLVIRTRKPVVTEDAYLAAAARAMLVGRSLGIGDADVNMQTIERPTARCAATGRRCASSPTPRGSTARSRTRRARPAVSGRGRRGRRRRAAAAADAPSRPPITNERTFLPPCSSLLRPLVAFRPRVGAAGHAGAVHARIVGDDDLLPR